MHEGEESSGYSALAWIHSISILQTPLFEIYTNHAQQRMMMSWQSASVTRRLVEYELWLVDTAFLLSSTVNYINGLLLRLSYSLDPLLTHAHSALCIGGYGNQTTV